MKIEALRRLDIRPTTDEEKLNQLEKRYLEFLRSQHPRWLGIQCITLKLGHDLRYTPDFLAFDEGGLRAIDVKGPHVWEDSIVKIKACARLFPFVHFVIAKLSGDIWIHTAIKP